VNYVISDRLWSGPWLAGCAARGLATRACGCCTLDTCVAVRLQSTRGGAVRRSLSRSATHRPAATARAVRAAHPPGAVAPDRHRPRANATTPVPSPAQPPLRACRAACTRLPRYGGPAGSSCRSGVPPATWDEVSADVLAGPSPRARHSGRLLDYPVNPAPIIAAGGRSASWPESGPRLLEQAFDNRDGPRSRWPAYSGYWPHELASATPVTSGL
jgi:hypothetical protein